MIARIYHQLSYILSGRDKRNAAVLSGLLILGALFEVIGVGAIPAFIGVISMPERLLEVAAVRWIYDVLGLKSAQEMVLWAAVALMVVFVLKNLYLAFVTYARSRFTSNRQVEITDRLFSAYMRAPYTFHLQRNTAELLRNTNIEAAHLTAGVLMPILNLLMEVMVLVFIFALLLAVEPLLTVVTFGVLGAVTYIFWRVTERRIGEYAAKEQHHRSKSVQAVGEGLAGIKDARVLGREAFFERAFHESAWFRARAERFRAVIGALPRLFLETIAVIALLGATLVLVTQGRDMGSIIPTLALLAVAVVRLMPSFQRISTDLGALKWGERALQAIYDDLSALESVPRWECASKSPDDPVSFTESIEMRGLTYRYPGQAGHALREVNLTIPRLSSVGFVGPSGSGKTTMVDVILGLLTPTAGQVLVDGVDIHTDLAGWQRKIGYIPQEIYLTDDTIRQNVAFGVDAEEIDDQAVWDAIDAAQLRTMIAALPDGLDTMVGERGVRLSGGQRQRIGIARALYHRPEILVMDEATSALDNQTERQFVDALERLQGDHTLITIAHRLSTVQHCEKLFMLVDGVLEAEGSYDELLRRSEAFREMACADLPYVSPSDDKSSGDGSVAIDATRSP